MSWNQVTQVECDECHRVIEVEEVKPSKIVVAMANRGWKTADDGRDLCEDCLQCCRGCGRSYSECMCEPIGVGEDN
jgi:hypothetical protein